MKSSFQNAADLLPTRLKNSFLSFASAQTAEEIRLRISKPPTVLEEGRERPFSISPVCREDIESVIEKASCSSVYAFSDELRRGFITARGAVRVGVCGCAATSDGINSIRDISSVSIRIAREVFGAGNEILKSYNYLRSTLIVSPPGGGKTTLLREMARQSSNAGYRVSIADERGELAGVFAGEPQFDVGEHTDILSFAPKAEGALMLLRAMNPQIIVLDEITRPEDCKAIETISNCGVTVYASAHASSLDDLRRRKAYRELLSLGVFKTAIFISGIPNRTYRMVQLDNY